MKKFLKRLLITAAVLALLVVVLIAVAFTSGFQTWVAHKVLRDNPDLGVGLDSVSAGLGGAEVTGITYSKDGVSAKVARFKADLSVLGATGDHITVDSIVAKGIELDLSQPAPAKTASTAQPATTASNGPAQPFDGIFPLTKQIGKKLSVKVIDIDGKVKLPAGQSATFTVTGGDIAPGATGKVKLTLDYANSTAGAQVSGSKLALDLGLTQLSEGGFSAFLVDILSKVQGAALKGAPEAAVSVKLEAIPTGESYTVKVTGSGADLVDLQAKLDRASGLLSATYKLSATDSQVAPLAMGMSLPPFNLKGDGTASFDQKTGASALKSNLAFNLTDLAGLKPLLETLKLEPTLLAQLNTTLPQIGALSFLAKVDAGVQGKTAKVGEFEVLVQEKAGRTLLRLASLTPLSINLDNPAALPDAARLATIELNDLPLAWAAPFAQGLTFSGEGLSTAFDVGVQKGVVALKAVKPLALNNFTLGTAATKTAPAAGLVDGLNLKLAPSATYNIAEQSFTAEIPEVSVDSRDGRLVTVGLKASGNLKQNAHQATVDVLLNLSGLSAQPALASIRGGFQNGVELSAKVEAGISGSQAKVKVTPLSLSQRKISILSLNVDAAVDTAKPAGLLPVTVSNLKVAGDIVLPELFRQPLLASLDNLLRGELKLDLSAQGQPNGDFKFNGDLNLQNLLARGGKAAPRLKLALDGKLGADRSILINAPLTVDGAGSTDLAVVAKAVLPEKGDISFDVTVDSKRLVVDDLKDLAAAFSKPSADAPVASGKPSAETPAAPVNNTPDTKPVWAGIGGQGSLKVGEVVIGNGSLLKNFTAGLKIAPDGITLSPAGAQLGDDKFESSARLGFKAGAKPYDLKANVSLPNFDSGAYLLKVVPNKLPVVEGKFVVLADLIGSAPNLSVLAPAITGSFTFKGLPGKFRPFAYSDDFDKVDGATSTVGAAAGLIGGLLGDKGGREVQKVADAAAKVQEVLDELRLIEYAQMIAAGERATNMDIILKELSITSESMRLVSTGKVTHVEGLAFTQCPISIPVTIWCNPRGEMARKLNNIGLLSEEQDERGFLKGFTYETTGTFEKAKNNLKDILTKAASTYYGGGKINLAAYRTGAPALKTPGTQPASATVPTPTPTPASAVGSLLNGLLPPPKTAPAPTPVPPAAPTTPAPVKPAVPGAPAVPAPTPTPTPKVSDASKEAGKNLIKGLFGN